MKSVREHRVPLSGPALAIVRDHEAIKTRASSYFQGSAVTPLYRPRRFKVLKRLKIEDATVHGFRSAFRDCAGNETAFPREIAEQALAHATGNVVEAAYRRSDALERRRPLMEAWASYCCEPGAGRNVIPIRTAL
jgi:integrase